MTDRSALDAFDRTVARAGSCEAAFDALCELAQAIVGAKLFTVMTVDMEAGLARRAYSSDPEHYPTSGTKPIVRNAWFATVHDRGETFVANTLAEIATVFPDHALIGSLGCGSVVNLPVRRDGRLAATVNLLHEAQYYGPERVALIERALPGPAVRALEVCAACGS